MIPPKAPNDIVEPAVVVTTGMQSGVDTAAGAAAAVAVLAFAAFVLLVADSCTPVPTLIVAPVDGGDSNAPGGVAIVKVGTLRGSQPFAIEQDEARKLATTPFARADGGEFAESAGGWVGNVREPVPGF